ncbi:MAG: hypothetical protein EA379_11225 [Phycisphaerales bacterium]|nr:MAG: hypothetical protein EA379_11225 [Phycisphaerales bacterium]
MPRTPCCIAATLALAGAAHAGFNGTDFEQYALGDIDGQAGWTVFEEQRKTGLGAHIVDRDGSRQLALFNDKDSPPGTLTGAFSPIFKNPDAGRLRVAITIDDDDGADYDVVGQSTDEGLLTFRVRFGFEGSILVLDNIGAGLRFIDTGVEWAQNERRTLEVRYDSAANSIEYRYDGALVYTGVAGLFAGTRVDQAVVLHDNMQNFGVGSFSGDPLAAAYVDSVFLIPAPGAALALGVGLLGTPRRGRRAPGPADV